MPPLVSVIIPCFNTERWIAKKPIDSCFAFHTYPNIEIIVVDDMVPTDNSLEIVKSYGKKSCLAECKSIGRGSTL
ncbi:glycosyltransferase family 2 protein [Tolypothrix bouteillei VB521301_2]|uniref:glycosyltransferase family 2 protein n=1 Tax=Tolypothrix bouteillei TaxID=1246981 RepID=UPI0038B598D4